MIKLGFLNSKNRSGQLEEDEIRNLNSFLWKLFSAELKEKSNSVFSPLSAFFALGMILNGAKGDTRKQIEETLGLSAFQTNKLASSLISQKGSFEQLKAANSAWISQKFEGRMNPKYRKIIDKDYQAEIKPAAFDESTVEEVNSWVSEKTDRMINQVTENFNNPEFVVINALAFDGKWEDPYEKDDIRKRIFRNADGTKSKVWMMLSGEELYTETPTLKGFIKLYKGNNWAFAAFLPKDQLTLDEAVKKTGKNLSEVIFSALKSASSVPVQTGLPQFDCSGELYLKENLESLGIVEAFRKTADFSGIISPKVPLYISDLIQKVKIEVDAQGTRAAALSMVMIPEGSFMRKSQEVICNQPFLYVVFNTETFLPAFIGVINQL